MEATMKKLSLRIDDIHVSGFEVGAPESMGAGTVNGADAITVATGCDKITCVGSCFNDTAPCSLC